MTLSSTPSSGHVTGPELDSAAADWVSLIATDPAAENIENARQWCARSEHHRAAFERARWLFVASGKLKPHPPSSRRDARSSRTVHVATAASVLLAIAVGWLTFPAGDYRNGAVLARRISLVDGSVVTLDVDSAVDVHFTRDKRDLHLLKGAALFEVAHDVRRPFVVHGLGVTATAVGTSYSVRRDADTVAVVVREGIVRIDCAEGGRSVELRRGHGVRCSQQQGPSEAESVDAEALVAWTRGRLKFDMTPLRQVVAEINRYRPGYVVITDPKLDDLPVSGVFRTDRLDDALIMLEQALQIRVRKVTDYLVLLD